MIRSICPLGRNGWVPNWRLPMYLLCKKTQAPTALPKSRTWKPTPATKWEKLVTVRRQRSHGILRALFGDSRFIMIYTLASTPSRLAVLHGSRKKHPEISPSTPRFGGSMFDFRRFLLETFVSVGHGYGHAGTSQVSKSDDTGSPESIKIRKFTVVGSIIFNTPRGVDQISPIDSFCYWLVAKTFQK